MSKENNVDTSNRDYHKAAADEAFRSKDIKKAIEEYTTAISFDPDWYILYSNRSAAYLSNGDKSKALADAKKCVELKPDFVKGHSRLASALYSLGRYDEARNVYKHILTELDPNHTVSKKGLDDCRSMELAMLRRGQEHTKQKEKSAKRFIRYQEFIDAQEAKGNRISKDWFWTSDDETQTEYIGPIRTKEQMMEESNKLDPCILEKDEETSEELLVGLGEKFTFGFWSYLNYDRVRPGVGAGIIECDQSDEELKARMPHLGEGTFFTCNVCEDVIIEQCEELRDRYAMEKRPLGRLVSVSAGKKSHKPAVTKETHEEEVQKSLMNLISILVSLRLPSLAYGEILFNMFCLLDQAMLYDPAIRRGILSYQSGVIYKNILVLRAHAISCAKDADCDLARSARCGEVWWTVYAKITEFLGEVINLHAESGIKTDMDVANEMFKKNLLPMLLQSVRQKNKDAWFSEEKAVWTLFAQTLPLLPKKDAVWFIKEQWKLLESSCSRMIEARSFRCERARLREEYMEPRSVTAAVNLINNLCNHGFELENSAVVPGLLVLKMMNKGVIPLLIKCARSKDYAISEQALSGLGQISRVKDCRRIMFQQPINDSINLIKEALTCNSANKASAVMLLVIHLAWDKEWHQPLKKMKPNIEDLIVRWATFCLHTILKRVKQLKDKTMEQNSNDSDLKWWNLEISEENLNIVNFTLYRCILLLSSSLFVGDKDLIDRKRRNEEDRLHLVSVCIDIPNSHALNPILAFLNNFCVESPLLPSKFPDPLHVLTGLVEHAERASENEDAYIMDLTSTLLSDIYKNPSWKPYVNECKKNNEFAAFIADLSVGLEHQTIYNKSHSQQRDQSMSKIGDVHDRCATLTGKLASCNFCGKVEEKRGQWKACSRCTVTKYCDRSCQKADWKVHKKVCKEIGK